MPLFYHYFIIAIHSSSHNDSPIQVYNYEHGDGVGSALDLILQGFIHAITMAAFPVVICAGVLYLLVSMCTVELVTIEEGRALIKEGDPHFH